MTPEYQVEELYEALINLRREKYNLEDKIQEILDFLVHSHITLEEFDYVQRIITGKEIEYKRLTRDTTIKELMEAWGIKGKKGKENNNE